MIPSPRPAKRDRDQLYSVMDLPAEDAIPADLPGDWWVAHTKPRTEKALAEELTRLGLRFYLPLRQQRTRSRRTGRISQSVLPVFSGYLFFNASEDGRIRALTTNRIVTTLRVARQAEFISELRQVHRVLAAKVEFQVHSQLQVGDRVRVVAGPLEGTEGVVVGRLSKARLVLNVGMLGQSVSVRANREILEPLAGPNLPG